MGCEIDDILNESSKTVQNSLEQLLHDLSADFNLELNAHQVVASPEATALRGAMQTFAVWVVQHGRK